MVTASVICHATDCRNSRQSDSTQAQNRAARGGVDSGGISPTDGLASVYVKTVFGGADLVCQCLLCVFFGYLQRNVILRL